MLGTETKPEEKVTREHPVKLEEVGVEVDQLISYFAWAEDIGPDGKPRRTESDMFFAEVRPFEEIFRPGPEGGEEAAAAAAAAGEGGGEAMKIAEVQKQIIAATWNLKRAEDGAPANGGLTEKYVKDAPVLRDSQDAALKQAAEMQEKAEDLRSKGLIEQVMTHMKSALAELEKAQKDATVLQTALTPEQAAYNALLKLAAREHQVVRMQRQQGQQGRQEQRNQRQLSELEMKKEDKKYETVREAEQQKEQQNAAQTEQLSVLNRLKELAKRQEDINEQLKECRLRCRKRTLKSRRKRFVGSSSACRKSSSNFSRAWMSAAAKMTQSENAANFAEERKQLEQTRERAQEAGESMREESVPKALAAGTRAERELEQLRDDFRKKSSAQFKDDMRQMRNDARDLADAQQTLGEKLKEENASEAPKRRTLDGSGSGEQLAQQFQQQKTNLDKLRNQMREVSEQAEAAEPLLSKELYDSLRKNSQAGTDETLKRAEMLAGRDSRTPRRATSSRKREQRSRS